MAQIKQIINAQISLNILISSIILIRIDSSYASNTFVVGVKKYPDTVNCEIIEDEEEKEICFKDNYKGLSSLPWWSWLVLSIILLVILLVIIRMLCIWHATGDQDKEKKERRRRRRLQLMQGCGVWASGKDSHDGSRDSSVNKLDHRSHRRHKKSKNNSKQASNGKSDSSESKSKKSTNEEMRKDQPECSCSQTLGSAANQNGASAGGQMLPSLPGDQGCSCQSSDLCHTSGPQGHSDGHAGLDQRPPQYHGPIIGLPTHHVGYDPRDGRQLVSGGQVYLHVGPPNSDGGGDGYYHQVEDGGQHHPQASNIVAYSASSPAAQYATITATEYQHPAHQHPSLHHYDQQQHSGIGSYSPQQIPQQHSGYHSDYQQQQPGDEPQHSHEHRYDQAGGQVHCPCQDRPGFTTPATQYMVVREQTQNQQDSQQPKSKEGDDRGNVEPYAQYRKPDRSSIYV